MAPTYPDRPEVYTAHSFSTDFRKCHQNGTLSLGFVPTMGALHRGHLSLIEQAGRENDLVVISIFVNPAQFGANEDLDKYPQTFDADMTRLTQLNQKLKINADQEFRGQIVAVLAPTVREMYPFGFPSQEVDGSGSFVTITPLGSILEGHSRPVFFRGVATVCMKLFNIVRPDNAYFGQKDIQQTRVIKRMVKDFHLGFTVRVVPTEREADGLALSSRNVYMGSRRRKVSVALSQALFTAAKAFDSDQGYTPDEIVSIAQKVLEDAQKVQQALISGQKATFDIEYVAIGDLDDLQPMTKGWGSAKGAVLSAAIKMHPLDVSAPGDEFGIGGDLEVVRLIDNVLLGNASE